MTVTIEFAPVAGVGTPASTPARRSAAPSRRPVAPRRRPVATVRTRVTAGDPSCVGTPRSPQPVAASSAVQLTRRGWALLLGVATGVAAVLVWVAFLSHPATPATASGPAPTQVVVQSGDTLWSIAHRVAPERDPRAVVYDLQQANHLGDSTVVVGQVLRVG